MQVVKTEASTHRIYEFIEDDELVYTVHQFSDLNDSDEVIDTIVTDKHENTITNPELIDFLNDLIDDFEKR